jgi:hypothetical protein
MSNYSNDARESRRLAEAPSCAVNADQRSKEAAIRKPVSEIAAYMDAGALFEAAAQLPEGPNGTSGGGKPPPPTGWPSRRLLATRTLPRRR